MNTISKHFLTAILQQLSSIERNPHTSTGRALVGHRSTLSNLQGGFADQAKSSLLTLHFLFPHELLPALDLLDRNLVTKLQVQYQHRHSNNEDSHLSVFYIQSASAVTEPVNRRSTTANSRYRNAWSATKVHYEVRLDSWNCTCAAFAQSQLKLLLADRSSEQTEDVEPEGDPVESPSWFGGVATKADGSTPICKHILAAAIARAAPSLFVDGVQTRKVSVEEFAAWAAGWGEV